MIRSHRFRTWIVLGWVLLAGSVRAQPPAADRVEFEIPPGDAAAVLGTFAEQSGCQVIFPTQLTAGLRLPGLRGKFTPRTALERLLLRTTLVAREDEVTGAFAIVRDPSLGPDEETRPRPAIQLPPYVVEELTTIPWRYAKAEGIEVLSQCSDELTYGLVHQHYALHAMLDRVLPRELQAQTDVPTTYVFLDGKRQSAVAQELLESLQRRESVVARAQGLPPPADAAVKALPNYRFWDADARAVFFVANREVIEPMMLTPSYVRYLLDHRTPALPAWFVEGMVGVYRRMVLNTEPSPRPGAPQVESFVLPFGRMKPNAIRIEAPHWQSEALVQDLVAAANGGDRERFEYLLTAADATPVPLAELMSRVPDEGDPAYARRWRDTAMLLVRYALGEGVPRRAGVVVRPGVEQADERSSRPRSEPLLDSLTHLLVAADKAPITEALFKSRFGFGYAEADRILREYLFASIGTPLVLDPVAMPLQDPVVLREAGDLDVSRLKGQLNRLEIDYVREIYPELTAKYIEQARRSLYRAYDLGARDPRLLAEIGLFHCDARDDAAALSFLEAAYDSGIIRPRVNYELARLRLHVLRRRQGDARFSAAELATVLQPLERTFLELPAMADVYDLYGEACLRSDTRATPVQLAAVRRGVAKFPRHGRLILSAALLHASAGQFDEARALVKQGLENPAAGPERKRLLQLQAALPARTN